MKPSSEEIFKWAREVYGEDTGKPWHPSAFKHIEAISDLAYAAGAAAMKERAAKECETEAAVAVVNAHEEYQAGREMGATVCAAAIRALGDDDE